MGHQKMRRTLLLDIPRNVSEREYLVYSFQWALLFMASVGALGMLVSALWGNARRAVEALEAIPSMGVAEAAQVQEPEPSVRLEGVLIGSETAAMPDEPGLEVVLGEIRLVVKTTEGGDEPREAELYRWEQIPETLMLVDGEARVRLEVEGPLVPRTETPRFGRPKRISDGASARISRTIGYRYLDQDFLLPEAWGPVRSASARVERSFVPVGSHFVVTGRLEPAGDGAVLDARPSSGGTIRAGTFEAIRASGERLATLTRFGWLPLLVGAIFLLRRLLRIRGEFVLRSNAR